jgi:integrase
MVPEVAKALDGLSRRERFTGDDELVFPSADGGYQDGSRLRRRYKTARKTAGLPELRFHDLRHCFGSLAIDKASIVQVQHWMGHADVQTTMRYLHHKSRGDEATLLADAFKVRDPASGPQASPFLPADNGFRLDAPAEQETLAETEFSRNEAAPATSL